MRMADARSMRMAVFINGGFYESGKRGMGETVTKT